MKAFKFIFVIIGDCLGADVGSDLSKQPLETEFSHDDDYDDDDDDDDNDNDDDTSKNGEGVSRRIKGPPWKEKRTDKGKLAVKNKKISLL